MDGRDTRGPDGAFWLNRSHERPATLKALEYLRDQGADRRLISAYENHAYWFLASAHVIRGQDGGVEGAHWLTVRRTAARNPADQLHQLVTLEAGGTLSFGSAACHPEDRLIASVMKVLRSQAKPAMRPLLLRREIIAYALRTGWVIAGLVGSTRDHRRASVLLARAEFLRLSIEMQPFLDVLDPEVLRVMRRARLTRTTDYDWLRSERRRQAVTAFPLFTSLFLSTEELTRVIDEGGRLLEAIAAYIEMPVASVRRLRKVSPRDLPEKSWFDPKIQISTTVHNARRADALNLLADLGTVAPDRLPTSRSGWRDFVFLREAELFLHRVRSSRELAPGRSLLSGNRGSWRDLAGGLVAEIESHEPEVEGKGKGWRRLRDRARWLMLDARDVDKAFRRAVIDPLAETVSKERMGTLGAVRRQDMAWDLIYGGLSPRKIVRKSLRCHKQPELFETARFEASWRPMLVEVETPQGMRIKPLRNQRELAEEGRAMNHCVASYAGKCAEERSVILSIRDENGERVSTVELGPGARDGEVRVIQNKAFRNAPPPPRAVDAVNWLAMEIQKGTIRFGDQRPIWIRLLARLPGLRIRFGADREQRLRILANLRLWSPHLEKPWKGMTVEAIYAALYTRMEAELAPRGR